MLFTVATACPRRWLWAVCLSTMALAAATTSSHERSAWRPARKVGAAHPRVQSPFPWDVAELLRRCKPQPLPMGGSVIHGALTDSEQQWLHECLLKLAEPSSSDVQGLLETATPAAHKKANGKNIPYPLVTWLHPYARRSSARERPTKLLDWADRLMHALAPASNRRTINSMTAQLYAPSGRLWPHRDENLSWGVSISLGSAATFTCSAAGGTEQRVTVRSGDIVVLEFGQIEHAVHTSNEPPPPWWRSAEHGFGVRVRCNVLFREALSAARQRQLCEERAMKVHGMSIAECCKHFGRDEAFFLQFLSQLDA